jgi:hypothetical protein
MKDKNWFTCLIFAVGILSVLYMFFYINNVDSWSEFCIILLFIFCLDFFHIKMPSGDEYNGNIVGFLYLFFKFNWAAAVLAFCLSTLAYNISSHSFRKIKWFRFVVSIGMYSICGLITVFVIRWTAGLPLLVRVFLAICTFELVNQLILSGIFHTVIGIPMFHNLKARLLEFIVPVLTGTVVVPNLLLCENIQQLSLEVLYAFFFLMIITFFSKKYMEQVSLRHNISREVVRLLENRITSRMIGHGTRVGAICESLLDRLEYP